MKRVLLLFVFIFLSNVIYAAGLDSGTEVATNFRKWFYSLLGIGAGIYMIYLIIMAKANKKTWSDVGMGFVHCAVAGGAITGADFMFNIW